MPVTRSHDPFPRRHSSHETLDAYVNGRRVVTILPADSLATRALSERKQEYAEMMPAAFIKENLNLVPNRTKKREARENKMI